MGKISGSHCLVLGCRNRQLLNSVNLRSYFRFPRDAELCKKWVDFCDRPELYMKYDENGPEYLYKSSRICSDHFQPTDFNNPNLFSQGLKKGSVPTVNPATSDNKTNGVRVASGGGGTGGGGGSGSSNGAGSPIDEKLLSVVASMPNLPPNLSLMMAALVQSQAAAAAAAAQTAGNQQPTNLKRSSMAMSGGTVVTAATAGTTTPTTTTTSSTPPSAKRNRAVPPLAAPTGALANLIQRQHQIKEQQLKEQLRKTTALGIGNGQVSITPAFIGGTSPNGGSLHHSSSNNNNNNNGGALSLVTTKKSSANNHHHNNNNNNNNVSNHNHNHHKLIKTISGRGREDPSEYGLKMVDMDMTGGESSEGDSSNQNSADEDYAYSQKLKVAKVEAVIPPSLKSQLTVTPAGLPAPTANNNNASATNNNNNVNANANANENVPINYKEKYEQTLNELFACRKIVKNQNKAIKQQQVEIDFLNQLLKEK